MARTVHADRYASKRKEILDATQRLIFTKGFEQMSIQDILHEAQISSGAFHHYFGSRAALLEGFIERIKQVTEQPLLPILHDPNLTAIEKLQGFFDTLDRLRSANLAEVVRLGRVWYTDDNARVRQKVEAAVRQQRAPLLVEIVRQGIGEGVFTTAYPEQAGEIILSLLQGMGDIHARLLLGVQEETDEMEVAAVVERIVSTHAAFMDALERTLGAPAHSLYRADPAAVKAWVAAQQAIV